MNAIFSLLAEAESAQLSIERISFQEQEARNAVALAEEALKTAKDALSVVRNEHGFAVAAFNAIVQRADEAGLSKSKFKNLVDDRVAALIASGLVDIATVEIQGGGDAAGKKRRGRPAVVTATPAAEVKGAEPEVAENAPAAEAAPDASQDAAKEAEENEAGAEQAAPAEAEAPATATAAEPETTEEVVAVETTSATPIEAPAAEGDRDLTMAEEIALEEALRETEKAAAAASTAAPVEETPAPVASPAVPPRPAFLRRGS